MVIGENEILTGAHVVANATFLQVQKLSAPDKFVARVHAVSHDCDLALLRVEDPRFAHDVQPADLGALPDLRAHVAVVGFPVGGEEISITEGVVSRIELQRYSHSQRNLLAVTVDAAINEGNSGGPVFWDGKVAGIAFQKLGGADGIGEMVPAPLIRRFLDGVRLGKDPRVPGLGVSTQNLENPALHEHSGLAPGQSGVLVTDVEYGASAWQVLQPGDVLTQIDGHDIANNGTISHHGLYRTRFDVLLGDHYIDDEIEISVIRNNTPTPAPTRLSVALKACAHLVPRCQYDVIPTYFIYAGLVFQTLTHDFLMTWGEWWHKAPKEFLHHFYSGRRREEIREIVILTQILADEVNIGYEHLYNEGIISVNGDTPRDMQDFVTKVEAAQGHVHIETSSKGVMTLRTPDADAARPRILERYHIHEDRSPDLVPETGPETVQLTANEAGQGEPATQTVPTAKSATR